MVNFNFSYGNSISGLSLSRISQSLFPGLSGNSILKFRRVLPPIMNENGWIL